MKKMRKKIAILLFALCATATVNAQEMVPINPQMASKFSQATCAADICGVYTWTYKTANRRTTQPDTLTAYSKLTDATSVVTISLLDAEKDSVLIWGMFDEPLHGYVSIQSGYYPSIRIAKDQIISTYKNNDEISKVKLNLTMYRKSDGAAFTNSTFSVTVYPSYLQIYSTTYDYWLYPTITEGTYANYNTGTYYLPGWQMTENETFKDYNGVMSHAFDKRLSNNVSSSYPVNIVQNGNNVSVTNFYNSGKTVNFILHADGSLEIPQQVGYSSSYGDFSTMAADYSAGTNKNAGETIYGTGDGDELNWGNWKLVAENRWTGAIAKGLVRYLDNSVNKFHFPIALTMTDAGWASFSSEKNLDFSTIAELTPYAVSAVDDNGATLSEVEVAVAANTGLFVEGTTPGTYEIPTVAEGNSLPANALVATSNATVVGDGATIWALGRDANSGGVGLQKVKNGTTVAANKACLTYTPTTGAKSFIPFNFGGTTAIEGSLTPNPSPEGKGSLYNLQGQRVGEGYRGIVIKNGKKVVKH